MGKTRAKSFFHKMKRSLLLLMYFVTSAMLTCLAQVTFVCKAPRTVHADEQFRVQYVLSGADGEGFSNPSFPDFEVLAGPSVSTYSSTQIVNMKVSSSSSQTYTYILQPTRAGSFTLPPATIRANGKVYKTNPVPVKISGELNTGGKSGKSPRVKGSDDEDEEYMAHEPQRAGSAITARDLYFTVTPSKRKVYEQEPILLTYKFHSRVGIGLANVMLRQKPDLTGFWTQEIELPRNLAPTTERKDGVLYRVGTNLQYVVFPQQSGQLTVPGVSFDCDVVQRDRTIDPLDAFFNGGGNINVKVQRHIDDLHIEVLPLPEPRPATFSGGVGTFTISTQLITPTPRTNDIATLRVIVRGQGNMRLIKAPAIVFPKDFDTYEVKMNDNTRVSENGISGEVHFDYTFVPRNVGAYDIPTASFTFFDPSRRDYVTLQTRALHLDVAKGTRSKEDLEAELAMRSSDIRDVHDAESAVNRVGWNGSSSWIGSWRYLLRLFSTLLIGIAALSLIRRRVRQSADVAGNRVRRAGRKANRLLRNVEGMIGIADHQSFYAALSQALRNYLADKLTLDATSITNADLISALETYGMDECVCQDVRHLLEDCDFARFAPAGDATTRQDDFTRASLLISKLETLFK